MKTNILVAASLGIAVLSLGLAEQSRSPAGGPADDQLDPAEAPPPPDGAEQPFPPGFGPPPGEDVVFPPPGFGGFGGPGMGPPMGPGMRREQELVKKFDKDSTGWLSAEERRAAREFLKSQTNQTAGRFGPGPGGPPRFGRDTETKPVPGEKVSPADVKPLSGAPLYGSNVLRTVFLDFEAADWEQELEDFHGTDVEVLGTLTVDGKAHPNVGVRFRGNTSYGMVGAGHKRPLNISVDLVHEDQKVLGYKTLNLLNAHEDPSMLKTVLAMQMARDFMPAPQANFVRLVINGESWGVYVNVEQFNKDFAKKWYGESKGARWKVPGHPGGQGGLSSLGDDVEAYKRVYEIKSKDEPKAWANLMRLCKLLEETPANELEKALAPVLDIDGALRFLAWDIVLVSGDGFWSRASDFNMYEDAKGQFHLIPYDVNETFGGGGMPGGFGPGGPWPFGTNMPPMGFGGPGGGPGGFGQGGPRGGPDRFGTNMPPREFSANRGPGQPFPPAEFGTNAPPRGFGGPWGRGPGRGGRGGRGFGPPGQGGGPTLDPLVLAGDESKAIASKLLAVPALRERYLGYVRQMAEQWLDWNSRLGPAVTNYHGLIAEAVKADTRKFNGYEEFETAIFGASGSAAEPGARGRLSLKDFAQQRRDYLMKYQPK